jgi:hypothetical protein
MATAEQFLPVFFKELQRDGQIDRAVAVARGAVRHCGDAWMPSLFMRLKTGKIWYIPGFGEGRQAFEKWPALLRRIRHGKCTLILGSDLSESLLGSTREIAQSWAKTYHFPMQPHEREDLPQVAQYLSVSQERAFPREQLGEYLREELLKRYKQMLSPDMHDAPLSDLFASIGAARREANPADPYRVLAELPFPIYITTNATELLSHALLEAGKDPQVELCRWNEEVKRLPSIYDKEPDYHPTPERPLVFHLFGSIDKPQSLVLTEDDYFDFLIGATNNHDLIPIAVREALADTGLLFLGYRLDDWSFRVLYRSIMSQEGRIGRKTYANIAGQVLPEEGRFLEPERARSYLDDYFQGAEIDIFWGSVEDFAKDLQAHLNADGNKDAALAVGQVAR